MLHRLVAHLFGCPDEEGGEEDDSRFVPSELDESVREAHGASQAEAERELASIEAQAELLEGSDEHRER